MVNYSHLVVTLELQNLLIFHNGNIIPFNQYLPICPLLCGWQLHSNFILSSLHIRPHGMSF